MLSLPAGMILTTLASLAFSIHSCVQMQLLAWVFETNYLTPPLPGPHCHRMDVEKRQYLLLRQYYFYCQCEACTLEIADRSRTLPLTLNGLKCEKCGSFLKVTWQIPLDWWFSLIFTISINSLHSYNRWWWCPYWNSLCILLCSLHISKSYYSCLVLDNLKLQILFFK